MSAEDVLLNNDVLFKCSVPSFVSDFVQLESWEDSEGASFFANDQYGNLFRPKVVE